MPADPKFPLNLRLGGNLSQRELDYVIANLDKVDARYGNQIQVAPGLISPKLGAFEIAEISTFIGAIASVGSFIVALLSQKRAMDDSRIWSKSRLEKLFAEEMFKLTVTNFRLVEFQSPESLFGKKDGEICKVILEEECSGRRFAIWIHKDGQTHALEVRAF